MNKNDSFDVKQLISNNKEEYEDNTEYIRQRKSANKWKKEIQKLDIICKKYYKMREAQKDLFLTMCEHECPNLVKDQRTLFDGFLNNTMTLEMILQVLNVIKQIENGYMDQNEASEKIGQVFLDQARMKCALDHADEEIKPLPSKGNEKASYEKYREILQNQKIQQRLTEKKTLETPATAPQQVKKEVTWQIQEDALEKQEQMDDYDDCGQLNEEPYFL